MSSGADDPGEEIDTPPADGADASARVQGLLNQARLLEARGDLSGALTAYRQAQSSVPAGSGTALELALIINKLEKQVQTSLPPPTAGVGAASDVSAVSAESAPPQAHTTEIASVPVPRQTTGPSSASQTFSGALIGGLLGALLLGVLLGLAIVIIGSPQPVSTVQLGEPSATPTIRAPRATASPGIRLTATATSPAVVQRTPTPLATAAVLLCNEMPVREFGKVWQENPEARNRIGCPTAPEQGIVGNAYQRFERGAMFWREDTNQFYAFMDNPNDQYGLWKEYSAISGGSNATPQPTLTPPPGRFVPVLGFGKFWSEDETLREAIGYAIEPEGLVDAVWQPYERGWALWTGDQIVRFMYDGGVYQRFDLTAEQPSSGTPVP